jgi:hypothetical protein
MSNDDDHSNPYTYPAATAAGYSITSSALLMRAGGTVMPSARAVAR